MGPSWWTPGLDQAATAQRGVAGTQPGWCQDYARDLWELHDKRGQVAVCVTAELLALGPHVEELFEIRFGVPFPKEDE
jgi:hypothetical protein